MVEMVCKYCNKTFLIHNCQQKKRKNCSKDCANKSRVKEPDCLATGVRECGSCHGVLPLSDFVKHRGSATGYYTYCKKCASEKSKESAARLGKTVTTYNRDKMRMRRLVTSNGVIFTGKLGKREYPTNHQCEICKEHKRLVYHHWDDNDLSKGMWICVLCHTAAHWLDKHAEDEYHLLKQKISLFALSRKVA